MTENNNNVTGKEKSSGPPQVKSTANLAIDAPKKSSGSGGKFFIGLLSLLALVLAGSGIALGYYAWQQLNRRIDEAAVDRQAISHELATIDENAKLQGFRKQVQQNVDSIHQQVNELGIIIQQQAELLEEISASAHETLAYVKRSQLGWGLKEVEHVLRMATHRVHIEKDIASAIVALNAANRRLHELNDPRLLPLRESISKQLGKLKNFPYPDWVGISLQLDNVLASLKKNIISDAKYAQEEAQDSKNTQRATGENTTGWKRLIDNVKNSINESVKITREEQRLKVFVSEQEKLKTYEFLRTKLLGAKYAVASRDDESYHRELEAALAWLENTDTLRNANLLVTEITELNGVDLEPDLPDITEANTVLLETMDIIENPQ